MRIHFSPQAKKYIENLDGTIKKRIKNKLLAYMNGEATPLRLVKPLDHYSKLRVGKYRIILNTRLDPGYVLCIEHRSVVYKKLK